MKTYFGHTNSMIEVIHLVDFGEKLKLLRKRSGLSQEQLAQRLGVTKGMVSSYETSMRMPSYPVLLKIAQLFHVSTDVLLGMESDERIDISGLTEKQKALVCDIITQSRESNG